MSESLQLNIGRAGEHLVMADLLMRNERAFLTDQGMAYDVIIERPERFIRLQVKTTSRPGRINHTYATSTYLFHIKRAGKGGKRLYDTHEFDGFALVALDTRTVSYLPFTDKISKTIILRDRRQTYKQNNGEIAPYFDTLTFERFCDTLTLNPARRLK